MEGIRDAFVHVTENNTTYYLDSCGYPIITWAGPIEIPRYDVDNNPFGYKKQLLHTVRTVTNPVTGEDEDEDVVVYYDSRGEAHVLMTEDDITRMFEYIQNEEAQIWAAIDTKQDELTAGSNIIIDKDPDTGVVTISATGSGAAYTAGANIQISPYNVISATDTTYSAGDNITINSNNVISATDTTYSAGQNITISDSNVISAIVDLSNYYNKPEINQLIADLDSISMEVVATLPSTGLSNVIYLVERAGTTIYDQWVYSSGQWHNVGDTNIDLNDYYTKTETDTLLDDKQDKLFQTPELVNVTDTVPLSNVTVADKTVTPIKAQYVWNYIKSKITGSASTVINNTLTSGKVVTTDAAGKITNSPVNVTELGYLEGLTKSLALTEAVDANAFVYNSNRSAGFKITQDYETNVKRRAWKTGNICNISFHCKGDVDGSYSANWTYLGQVPSGFRPKYKTPIVAMVYDGTSNQSAGGYIGTDGWTVIWTNSKIATNNYQVRINATYLIA